MTSTSKAAAATSLDMSFLVEGEPANSSDVSIPLTDAETAIDTARSTLSVTANDTHVKNLDDAVLVTAPITKTVTSPGGDEKITIALDQSGIAIDGAQITSGTVPVARLPELDGTDGVNPGTAGIVPAPADTDAGKYLRADGTWQPVAGAGTVTSVALTVPSDLFSVTGSPVTASGTLALAKASGDAAKVYATPASSSGVPELRALEAAHIPTIPSSKLSDRGMTTLVANTTLASDQSSITISSISGSYTHLRLYLHIRSAYAALRDNLFIRINGNSSSGSYLTIASRTYHSATIATNQAIGNQAGIYAASFLNAADCSTGRYTFLIVELPLYTTSAPKHVMLHGFAFGDNTSGNQQLLHGGGYYAGSEAITSITVLGQNGNIVSGSAYSLYGIG